MVSSVAYIIIINVSVRTRIFYVFFILHKCALVRFLKTGTRTGRGTVPGFSFSTGKCGWLLKFIGYFIILGYQNNELILKEVKDGKENIIRKMNLPTNKPYLKIKITEGCNCSFFWSKNQKVRPFKLLFEFVTWVSNE